jgi:regulator of nucleoside diphosphate kinase
MVQAESLSGLWSITHADAGLILSGDEVHYLRGLALALDNDLVSHLILRKLRIARILPSGEIPPRTARMNSRVEYSIDQGERQSGQLVHPSLYPPADGISVASLLGAGIIGLREGQVILWPTEAGRFSELCAHHVEDRLPPLRGRAKEVGAP